MSSKLQSPRNTCVYSLGRTNSFRAASHALFENKGMGFDGFGSNLQNISDDLRAIYIPDDNYKLGQVDQSGAEARIVAYLCKPGKYRDLFIYDIKPHVYVGIHLFKDIWKSRAPELDIDGICVLQPSQLKDHPHWKSIDKLVKSSDKWPASERYYYLAKQTCHSSNYGIKAPTFMMNTLEKSGGKIALSRRDAEFFLNFYRATFPEIVKWNIDTYEFYLKHNKLFNLFGHPREFCGGEDAEKIYAFVPQSTVGEITHMAIRDMQRFIEREHKDWHILQNNHDSYLMEFPPAEEVEAMSMMRKFIEIEFTAPDGSKFSMKSEGKTGHNWKELKEI